MDIETHSISARHGCYYYSFENDMAFFLKFIKKTIGQFLMKIKLGKIIFIAAALNLIFGVLFYWAEQDLNPDLTIIDSIWWAMVTMTTVGYGDFYAQSIIGRFLISSSNNAPGSNILSTK
jgi:voltage-gated potassium channel Kch